MIYGRRETERKTLYFYNDKEELKDVKKNPVLLSLIQYIKVQ